MEFVKENLNQARHVENERMLFNSLFGALVGGALALSAQVAPDRQMVVLIMGLLLIINTLSLGLTLRWNKIFARHWGLARSVYLELLSIQLSEAQRVTAGHDLVNKYFYFDNRSRSAYYVSTAWFFILYNLAILALLLLALFRFTRI